MLKYRSTFKNLIPVFIALKVNTAFSQEFKHPELVQKLEKVYEEDQKYRLQINDIESRYGRNSKEMNEHWDLIKEKDTENVLYITSVLDSLGWLGKEEVGSKASNALFLVIQHASPEVQEKYIPLMRAAVKNEKASADALAMLEDRLALSQGKLQIYGSQLIRYQDMDYQVCPMIDPEKVNQRRLEMGLGPIEEYLKNWDIQWDLEKYLKILPELIERQKKVSYSN